MGTTMSWAEFKDFKINLTEATASAGNSSQISSAFLPEGVTQISYEGDRTAARNGIQHGWQYAAFQFDVDGPVDIIIGGCGYSGVNATITDAKGSFSKELDTNGIGCGGVAVYKYIGGANTLKVYCGQFSTSIKVQKTNQESFEATWDWTGDNTLRKIVLNAQGTEGLVSSSVCWLPADSNNDISMYVDAFNNGGLRDNGNSAQCVTGTRLLVPVYSVGDKISVVGYGGSYTDYSIHGTTYTGNADVEANADDVKQGYIVISGNINNNYIKSVTLKHTASSASSIAFEDFKIDFRSNPYTVVLPAGSGLPACVTVDGGTFHENQHGYSNAVVTVKVDGPVKFTIGSCGFNSAAKDGVIAKVSINGGEPVDINNDTDCDNTGVGNYKKFVEYRYNKEEAATLTFNLGSYCPYFFAEKYELIPEVKVTYYDANGTKVIATETVEGGSELKFKYGAANVTVPAGDKFRGWYDSSSSSAKPVEEGKVLTTDIKLYAKVTPIEVATTTSVHTYDLTKANWYQNEHDLIEISGGKYNNEHGWDIANGGTIKLQVAGDALVSVGRCQYGSGTTIVATDASGNVIATLDAKAASDGGEACFKYVGKATTLTLTFASQTYLHGVSVEHFVPVAFEPFQINFRTNPYTVISPSEGLPKNVNITGGKFYNEGSSNEQNQHGYRGVTMTVVTDRPVKFTIGTCDYTDNATVSVDGGAPEVIKTNLKTESSSCCDTQTSYDKYVTYVYEGTENAVIKFSLGLHCPYFFAEEMSGLEYDENTRTFNVAANKADQLKEAIKEANTMGGNVTIYLPNGTYDFGTDINTEIKARNIAIIGESRDGVIIKNSPVKEGLDKSATLKNTSTGLYLQDVTIQCDAPYNQGTQAERGVALWDQGTQTICKNVYLKGRQDVYYSNGANGMKAYFEGGKIEGTVDFVCGSGNILFNSVNLIVTTSANKTEGGVIAAPSTYASETGHVFVNCLVSGAPSQSGTYKFARGWHAHGQAAPAAIFVGTITNILPDATSYWGENIGAVTNRRFAVYGTNGTVIVADNNAADITKASLVSFAGAWDPAEIISTHSPIKTNGAGWASYTAFTDVRITDGAKAYVAKKINAHTVTLTSIDEIPAGTPVFIYGDKKSTYHVEGTIAGSRPNVNYLKPVLFDQVLTSSANAFVIGTKDGTPGLYKVSSKLMIPAGKCYLDASSASSFALAKEQLELVFDEEETTGIDNVVAGSADNASRYNLAGQKVGNDYKGIVIKGGKKYFAK